MHVVFFNVLGSGHVNPTLPVVETLTRRGDRVTYFCYPARREAIEQAGADFRNYGDDAFSVSRYHPEGSFPTQLIPAARGLMPFLIPEVQRLDPDVIVFDTFAPWGFAVASFLGKPAVGSSSTFVFSPNLLERLRMGPEGKVEIDEANEVAFEELLTRWRTSLSKEYFPVTYGCSNIVYTAESFNPPLVLDPNRFTFVGPMLQRRAAPASFSLEAVAADPRKKIYVSMGTIIGKNMGLGRDFYAPFFEAFADRENYLVIVSTGGVPPETIGEATNFIVCESVPQLDLLPSVDVFISHCGMNSTNESMYFGVPIVAMPFFGDQPINAEVVQSHGAGLVLDRESRHAQAIGEAVERILEETSFRQATADLGSALRDTPGVDGVLAVIDGSVAC